MPTGLPDYYSRSYVNIDQQTISEVAIDIARQSLANLDININQQTVSELAIDIAKQTIATLNIDITNQSIGNLAMDIAQQSIGNLGVDIGSQSIGNLDIDIKNQSISELSIDIAKQTIGQLFQRPVYGSGNRAYNSQSMNSITYATLHSISGQGKIYGGYVFGSAGDDHSQDKPVLYVDGRVVLSRTFQLMWDKGLMGNPFVGFSLLRFDQNGYNYGCSVNPDITFEGGFELQYGNSVATNVDIESEIYYALI